MSILSKRAMDDLEYGTEERSSNGKVENTYWNLINPFAALVRSKDTGVRVPRFMERMFMDMGMEKATADRVSHALASAAVVAAAVGVGRYAYNRFVNRSSIVKPPDMSFVQNAGIGKSGVPASVSGTPSGTAKKASAEQALAVALPLATTLVAAKLAGDLGGYLADTEHLERVKASEAGANRKYLEAVKRRLRIANGEMPAKAVAAGGAMVKGASLRKESADTPSIWSGKDMANIAVGLTALATAAAAYVGYRYESKANESNLMYKAYEKGLKEYARSKAQVNPIVLRLSSNPKEEKRFFSDMDALRKAKFSAQAAPAAAEPAGELQYAQGQQALEPVRDVPEFDGRLNKPVSVTL